MDWIFNVPIKFFEYDLNQLKERLNEFNNKNILLIASKRLIKTTNLIDYIKNNYNETNENNSNNKNENKNNKIHLIDESIKNPDINLITRTINQIKVKPDLIIAIGGGSSIDLGKAISGFSNLIDNSYSEKKLKEEIIKSLKTKEYLNNSKSISLIAVPTTAGTGSECTKWGTIWDFDNLKKYSIDANYLYPKEAWLIPELTLSLNKKQTLATGLDALSHAIEAYWSQSTNEYIQRLSANSIKIITEFLPLALDNEDNLEYRQKLLMGSFFAGLSFSNTRTTACHSISYPLTMKYDIEHGIAVTLTLFSVLKRNWKVIKDKNLFLESWNAKEINDINKWIKNTSEGIQELKLSKFNVKKEEIPEIVKLASTGGRMDNNPIIFNEKEIEEILNENF